LTTETLVPAGGLSGYASEDAFIATRKKMGGRWVIHIDMSISQLVLGVEAPPVGVPQQDNREVLLSRCKDFAAYVDDNQHWGSPSLMLWCPDHTVRFEPLEDINKLIGNGVQVGILYVPRNSRLSIRILDGQHRIKGFHLWVEAKNAARTKAIEHLGRARELKDDTLISEAKHRLQGTEQGLQRIEREYIGVDLIEVNTAKEAKQVFADIANHAKGMTKALTTGFDTSKMVNRVTQRLVLEAPHPLLDGRVDWNKDRLGGSNPNLLTAKTVADIVRATYVGVLGRVSKVQERAAEDVRMEQHARRFFNALMTAFPELASRPPQEQREDSLVASGTMLRVLAGAWHALTNTTSTTGKPVKPLLSDEEVTTFFKSLAPYMGAPVRWGNPWLTTGNFPSVPEDGSAGVMAPSSRSQDLKGLTESLTRWATGAENMPF
jgi:hypothetical protein